MRAYKTAIVIPVYGKWHLVNSLLHGLATHEKENIDEVYIVDDHSPIEAGQQAFPISPNLYDELLIIPIINKENLGFTKSSNVGLRAALGEIAERKIIFLISSDVRVNGKFIGNAEEVLLSGRRYLLGNRHIAFDTGWNRFDGIVFDYLEGWFLGTTSDGWRDLDFFDENYSPYDYEDIDLSTSAKRKGYKLVSMNNPRILHLGGGTIGYNPAREEITKRNRRYFQRKWLGV